MKSKTFYVSIILLPITAIICAAFWWYSQPMPLYRVAHFQQLPGWDAGLLKKSLATFKTSCRAFVKQEPEKVVGTDSIILQAKDWQPACQDALKLKIVSERLAKAFFQKWFVPVEFYDSKHMKGLFTGYYLPSIKGSRTKSPEYSVPLYEVPDDLVNVDLGLFIPHLKNRKLVGRLSGNKLIPYYTREQINKGAIKNKARVLLWIHSPIDRLFLEIQGSGIIELEDGSQEYVGYDAQNGAPYTAIAGVLIKKGVMTKDTASMQAIKRYLEEHPKQMDPIINKNKSFVFFRKLNLTGALGSQGVALTPGYSLAVDVEWVPMGTPLWLSTSRPDAKNPEVNKPMQRLMIAQDTGGAIKGKVRGDVFWGGGERATLIAGHMKNEGHYWLLLPKHTVARLEH